MVCLYNQEQGQENEMWYGVGPLLHHIVQKPSWWQFCYLNVWLEVINIHLEQGEEDGGGLHVCMGCLYGKGCKQPVSLFCSHAVSSP